MADFSLLDRDDVRAIMFYPRRETSQPPPGARDFFVDADDGTRIHARVFNGSPDQPTVVFFHGNGEIAADYDDISALYMRAGLNLAVCEYRGYGLSAGSPAYTAMMADAHLLQRGVFRELDALGWHRGRYLMGRSLGALSALELAATDADGFRGLVLESGAGGLLGWARWVKSGDEEAWQVLADAQRERLGAIRLPLLTIHGEQDELIPVQRALEVHESAGSAVKELLVVPGAGHNDLLFIGMRSYFEALTGFIGRCEAA